jgi:hypothetical protein
MKKNWNTTSSLRRAPIPRKSRSAFAAEIDSSGDLVLHTAGSEFRMHKPIIYQTIASRRRAVRGSFVRKGKREVAFRLGAYDRSLPLIIDPAISFATFFGGNGAEDSFGIAVDDSTLGSPKLYVDGFTRDSTTFPESSTTIGSGTSTTPHVIEVGFVAKIDPTATGSASLIYLTFVGGKTPSISTKLGCGSAFIWLALDKSQGPSGVQPVLGGETSCSDFPTTVVLNPVTGSGMNIQGISAVATRLNPGGNAVDQSATLGGNNDVQGGFIAVNSAGDIILSGETAATNLPAKNAYVSNFNNGVVPPPFDDCFVSRLNRSDLSLNYLTYLNTGANSTNIKSTGCGAFEDSSGNILAGGNTFSTTAFNLGPGGANLANGFQTALQGTQNTFAIKLNPTLSGINQLLYATYFGGGGTTQASNGSFDLGNGVIAIVGGTTSATTGPNAPDIPMTKPSNAFQSSNLAAASTNGQTGYLLLLDSTKTGLGSLLCSTYF